MSPSDSTSRGPSLVPLRTLWIDDPHRGPAAYMGWKAAWPDREERLIARESFINTVAWLARLNNGTAGSMISTPNDLLSALTIHLQFTPYTNEWMSMLGRSSKPPGFYVPSIDRTVTSECARLAYRIVLELVHYNRQRPGLNFDFDANRLYDRAIQRVQSIKPRQGGERVLLAALAKGIPIYRLSRDIAVYQLGQGIKRRLLWRMFTGQTSHIGTTFSTHKDQAHQILQRHQLPLPAQATVNNVEEARRAARTIGYPVVVKPSSTDKGTAVTANITTESQLLKACEIASSFGTMLVEKHVAGEDFRFLVISGRCVGVTRRSSARIMGDGASSVASLVAKQAEERRKDKFLRNFGAVSLNDPVVLESLKRQNLKPETIVDAGKIVVLRENANVSTGGTHEYVTELAHPDNLRMAERAALCLGLDIAGVDFLTPDISRSWRDGFGAICEVNATPALSIPGAENHIVAALFSANDSGRIPAVLIIGSEAVTEPYLIRAATKLRDRGVCPTKIHGGRAVRGAEVLCRGSMKTGPLLRVALSDPRSEAILIACSDAELLAEGLPIDHLDLVVMLTTETQIDILLKTQYVAWPSDKQIMIRPDSERFEQVLVESIIV